MLRNRFRLTAVIGCSVRIGRRYKAVGLELLAARNGQAITATLATDLAEDIAEVVASHANAEDLAEFSHELLQHIADTAATGEGVAAP